MKEIAGRSALLTGASGGIGRSIAEHLARAGVRLVLTGRREDALAATAEAVRSLGGEAAVVPAELADRGAIEPLLAAAEAEVGPVDILVNNAGVETIAPFTSLGADELAGLVDVNVTGPLLLTRAALPGMLERGRGHVVFVSSAAGLVCPAYTSSYAASKAALVALTRALRAEFRGAPVGFSVVCPGFVEGDGMYQRVVDEGHRAPRVLGRTTTARVAAAVIDAITADRPTVLRTGAPTRPLLAVAALAPRLGAGIGEGLGVNRAFRGVALARESSRLDQPNG